MIAEPALGSAPVRGAPRRLWMWLVVLPLCYWGALVAHPGWFLYIGIRHYGVWFIDPFALLASNDALARGLDVYAPNPLDYFGRAHLYSHWWFILGRLGLTRADNFWVGLTLGLTFFAAAVAWLRPRTPGELLWYLAVLVASPVLLAVERANADLVIFILLTPVVPCLLSSRAGWQWVAVLLIMFAAGLKFYPAVAGLVLLAPAERRMGRWRVVGGALGLALVAVNVAPGFHRVLALMPPTEGLMTFGAINLFTPFEIGRLAPWLSIGLATLAVVIWWRANIFCGWDIPRMALSLWLHFVLGAVLLCGCFFSAPSFAYRWIFALWLAPWLWWAARETSAPRAVRRLTEVTIVLLGAALWLDPMTGAILASQIGRVPGQTLVRAADIVFRVEQPITWALFICLLGFLTQFVRDGLRHVRVGVAPDTHAVQRHPAGPSVASGSHSTGIRG